MKKYRLFLAVCIFVLLVVLYGTANAAMRGRPRIVGHNAVAENGWPLRGDTARVGKWVISDKKFWQGMRDQFNYNIGRIFVYRDMRSPTEFGGTGQPGDLWLTIDECIAEIDKQVQYAEELGMYALIEYVPVPTGKYMHRDEPWKTDSLEFWDRVALRYKDKTHVIYALSSEPGGGYKPESYLSDPEGDAGDVKWQEDEYLRVRAIAPNTMLSMWEFAGAYRACPEYICMTYVVNTSVGKIDYSNAFVGFHLYGIIEKEIKELSDNYPTMPTGGCKLSPGDDSLDTKIDICLRNGVTSWILLSGTGRLNDPFAPIDAAPVIVRWSKDPLAVDGPTTPDTTPPIITITSPANNATVSSFLTVSGTAYDNVALSKVEVKVGIGGTYTAASGALSPWNKTVTLTTSGSNVIYARATDTATPANQKETTVTVTYTPGLNNSPNTPNTPTGTTTGNIGVSYTYSTSGTDPDGDQVKYTFDWGDGTTNETNLVNSGTGAGLSHSWTAAGTYQIKTKATDSKGAGSGWSTALSITITPTSTQHAYHPDNTNSTTPWQISSVLLSATTIEAENYDTGGEDVAYNDTTPGNSGNAYRTTENVDVQECTDTGGGYNIGWTKQGEWLEYSVNVSEGGEYQIILRTARDPAVNDIVHLEFVQNGVTYFATPSVSLPATGGWQVWKDTEVVNSVILLPGDQIMKLVFDNSPATDCSNINYIKIIKLTPDTTPPEVSAVSTTSITGSQAVVTWTTNEPANSKVQYGTTLPYSSTTTLASFVTSHSVPITGLTEKTLYHYRIITTDMSNNPTTTGDYVFTTTANDPDAPLISNVHAGVTQDSAVITWTTNEPSDSQVAYGLTTAMGSTTTLIATLVPDHSVLLSNLEKGKTYYYKVYSKDSSGNLAISTQYSFKTSNLQHRIYTYYYDNSTTPASLKFLLQVYNDENSLATDYSGTLTIKTKDSNGTVVDSINSTFIESDSGEKNVSIPLSKDINTLELTGDTTTTIMINFSDLYISKLVGNKGGTIEGVGGIKIVVPSGVVSIGKYLATIKTSVPPAVQNTMRYVNTVNPICYDFGELTFGTGNAPVLENQVFTRAVNITIPYTATDIGTLNEDGLRIYYWTGTDWDLVTGVQTVDKSNNTVTANVRHFSTYRILGSYVFADMSNVNVYPNPYNPATAVSGKLKITNLPINSIMKIYTVTGEKIRELKEIEYGNLGWLEWDGKNDDGDKVGRAVYIYQIEDTAGNKKTGKIGLVK
ncbi:MAG: carbohydrate-binding protein [Elusimicrobia bacterium]|nr:carbohydrate-binding protein [Elusimicrobiota bacterium]